MQELLPRVESGTETENNAGAIVEAQRGRSYASCVCDISASMHVTQRKAFILSCWRILPWMAGSRTMQELLSRPVSIYQVCMGYQD